MNLETNRAYGDSGSHKILWWRISVAPFRPGRKLNIYVNNSRKTKKIGSLKYGGSVYRYRLRDCR